jgi:hypothetical protein
MLTNKTMPKFAVTSFSVEAGVVYYINSGSG